MALASNIPFADVPVVVLFDLFKCITVPSLSYLSNITFQPIVVGDIYEDPFNPHNHLTMYPEDFKSIYYTSADTMKVMNLKKSLSFLTHDISCLPSNIDEFKSTFRV